MGSLERRMAPQEADLQPWQREVGAAYTALGRAQDELAGMQKDDPNEEGIRMNVARRVGSLARVLDAASANGVRRVPDVISINTSPDKTRWYYTLRNEVKDYTLTGPRFFRSINYNNPQLVSPSDWVDDTRLIGVIKDKLMGLIPESQRSTILAVVNPVPAEVINK
jgi:hypothetical protein